MGDGPALLARRFWALPSCSPARRVRPAPGLLPHRSHGGGLPLLSPDWDSPSFRTECPCSAAQSLHPPPARRVAPVLRRGRKPRVPQSRKVLTPRPTLPVTLSGPWGSALLLRALRRSRTRP